MNIKTFLAAAAAAAVLQSCSSSEPGVIQGEFSVSESQKVMFSQGSLQFQPSTGVFKFADNQWDVVGESNASLADGYDGWIDLFAYGSGDNAAAARVEPGKAWSEFGANAIQNGGNKPGLWRTLSTDEWLYLITKRPGALEKMSPATVSGVKGYVLLPDSFELSGEMKFEPFPQDSLFVGSRGFSYKGSALFDRFGKNIYTAEQWAAFQDKGAVFMPCCGGTSSGRYSNRPENPNGKFWTSTSESDGFAKTLDITTNGLDADFGMSTGIFRNAIRLVKDVKAK